jgi:hypothetical protein
VKSDRVAVFTLVQNEPQMFPIWWRYYTKAFPSRDIYVLDHDSEGDGVDAINDAYCDSTFNWLRVRHPLSYDHAWMTRTASTFQHYLLQSYAAVLFTAADEIVIPPPDRSSLVEYIQASIVPYERCDGYEIVHRYESEPALDWTAPLLAQRSWWYGSAYYSKPLLARIPLYWDKGFQVAHNVPRAWPRSRLQLLHLHKIDLQQTIHRHQQTAARRWHPEEHYDGPYRHNRLEDPEKLQRWLLSDADDTTTYANLVPIPDTVKAVEL